MNRELQPQPGTASTRDLFILYVKYTCCALSRLSPSPVVESSRLSRRAKTRGSKSKKQAEDSPQGTKNQEPKRRGAPRRERRCERERERASRRSQPSRFVVLVEVVVIVVLATARGGVQFAVLGREVVLVVVGRRPGLIFADVAAATTASAVASAPM